MAKTFIFDWSGTLSNNVDDLCKVYELMRQELGGKPLTKEQIRATFTLPYMKFWNLHFPNLTKEKQDELYKKFMNQIRNAKIYPTTKETILHLHQKGHKIFIVSSDHHSTLIPEIEESGLKEFFTEIKGESYEKQYAISYLLKKHNLDPENTFYTGDTSGDIEAGKIAGVKTIGISWGFQSKKILAESKPDFLIDDIVEIKHLFK